MLLATKAMPETRLHFCHFPAVFLYSLSTVDSNSDGNTQVTSVPVQRVIMAQLMHYWLSHQYVLGDLSLSRSDELLGLKSFKRFKTYPTPFLTFTFLHFPLPLKFRRIPLLGRGMASSLDVTCAPFWYSAPETADLFHW